VRGRISPLQAGSAFPDRLLSDLKSVDRHGESLRRTSRPRSRQTSLILGPRAIVPANPAEVDRKAGPAPPPPTPARPPRSRIVSWRGSAQRRRRRSSRTAFPRRSMGTSVYYVRETLFTRRDRTCPPRGTAKGPPLVDSQGLWSKMALALNPASDRRRGRGEEATNQREARPGGCDGSPEAETPTSLCASD
jgi:hypothetical protein